MAIERRAPSADLLPMIILPGVGIAAGLLILAGVAMGAAMPIKGEAFVGTEVFVGAAMIGVACSAPSIYSLNPYTLAAGYTG